MCSWLITRRWRLGDVDIKIEQSPCRRCCRDRREMELSRSQAPKRQACRTCNSCRTFDRNVEALTLYLAPSAFESASISYRARKRGPWNASLKHIIAHQHGLYQNDAAFCSHICRRRLRVSRSKTTPKSRSCSATRAGFPRQVRDMANPDNGVTIHHNSFLHQAASQP